MNKTKNVVTTILIGVACAVPIINYAFVAELPSPVIPVLTRGALADDTLRGTAEPIAVPVMPLTVERQPQTRVVGHSPFTNSEHTDAKDAKDFKDKEIVVPELPPPVPLPSPPHFEFVPHVHVISP